MPLGDGNSAASVQVNAAHKTGRSGGKVKKAKSKEKKERHNPKAFTFSGGIASVQRRAQYALDHETKREKAKLIPDKTPEDSPPPVVVAVQGPPGVGKSTLIRSLVKHYTRHNVSEIKGAITLVGGKKRRLTLLECPNDAASMLDVAKVADLVLLLIDGSYGFELETFEFLNVLQVHGFPKVIGVLTHLDEIKETRTLRKTKKKLKNRFWAEIYNGAKLFYLSGLQYGRYNKTEILNLSRFIAVQKPRPLEFRSQRPYLVALRYEDQTSAKDKDADPAYRTVHFYGYVNGATLRSATAVHIPGAGDFIASDVQSYLDPCPLPSRSASKNDGARNLRTLKQEERRVYAPECDIGNVTYDADSLYIKLPDHRVGFTRKSDPLLCQDAESEQGDSASDDEDSSSEEVPEPVALVRDMQDAQGMLDQQVESQKLRLMPTSYSLLKSCSSPLSHKNGHERRRAPEMEESQQPTGMLGGSNLNEDSEDDSTRSEDSGVEGEDLDAAEEETSDGYDEASDAESHRDGSSDVDHKDILGHRVGWVSSVSLARKEKSMAELIYQTRSLSNDNTLRTQGDRLKCLFGEDHDDDVLDTRNGHPASALNAGTLLLGDCDDPVIAQMPETSLLSDAVAYQRVGFAWNEDVLSVDTVLATWSRSAKAQLKKLKFITGGWDGEEQPTNEDQQQEHPEQPEGEKEDDRVENILKEQRLRNREADVVERANTDEAHAFLRSTESGFVIGTYCRVVVKRVPAAWVDHLQTRCGVLVLGGLLPSECGPYGFLQTRVKKHRWAPKILKSEDPLLISVGWRRFQSLPLYCLEDRNAVRVRALKYTPEHMHCLATFYGPLQPPGTGVVAIRNWASDVRDFRISATGVVLETATQFTIMKKLKLVGEPVKVFKNTAFVKNMFTSDLEVAKCTGSRIQTVSGIRGQIKKAQGTDGSFRATFEDKILMSDIVICKTWIRVDPKRFCNPLLDIPEWRRLRTHVELRRALGIPQADASRTDYGSQPTRETRRFNPLRVPKELAKSLPFDARPKDAQKKKVATGLVADATAVCLNAYEKRVATLFQRLHLITKQRQAERKQTAIRHRAQREKAENKAALARGAKTKELKKRQYAAQGIQASKLRKRLRMDS